MTREKQIAAIHLWYSGMSYGEILGVLYPHQEGDTPEKREKRNRRGLVAIKEALTPVAITQRVRCHRCKQIVTVVPCLTCFIKGATPAYSLVDDRPSPQAVDARTGTQDRQNGPGRTLAGSREV